MGRRALVGAAIATFLIVVVAVMAGSGGPEIADEVTVPVDSDAPDEAVAARDVTSNEAEVAAEVTTPTDPAQADADQSDPAQADPAVGTDPAADGGADAAGDDAPADAVEAPEAAGPDPNAEINFTMAFSGDILSHTPVIAQALAYGGTGSYDYGPMFADVRAELSAADLAICVLETPISSSNGRLTGYPTFYAPTELAAGIAGAGFDGCATASNHSIDQSIEGLNSTLNQLDRAGVGHAGMARDQAEAQAITTYDVDGVTVAHLSYTYGLNGLVLPDGEEYRVNVTEETAVLDEAARAREAGADVVVLSIQWGNEYQREPTPVQLGQADVFTASGDIDLIVGNHAHVVQPIAVINDVPVIFGLGNFLSNQSGQCCPPESQDGVIVIAHVEGTLSEGLRVTNLDIRPTWVDRSDYTIRHLPDELDKTDLDNGLRELYQLSFNRTMESISLLGAQADDE